MTKTLVREAPRANLSADQIAIAILVAAFLVKVPFLSKPLIGHFASYQSDLAMMASMMLQDPQSILFPRMFILLEGKPALHLIYYPFSALIAAGMHVVTHLPVDFLGRIQAALFTAASGWSVYAIAKKYFSPDAAILSTLLFSFSPMVLVSGLSFQNEAVGVFFVVTAFRFLMGETVGSAMLAGILFSLALLARLHFAVLTIPFIGFLFLEKTANKKLIPFLIASLIPALLWFGLSYRFKSDPSVMTSLFVQLSEGRVASSQWLVNPDFYQRVLETMVMHWTTPVFFAFFLLGLANIDRSRLPFVLWVLSSIAVAFMLPQKVYDHPFYLICGIPAASILSAVALSDIRQQFQNRVSTFVLSAFFVIAMAYYIPPAISGMRSADRDIPEIGRDIQRLSQPEDRIIAQHGSSPELLYYCQRKGWPFNLDMAVPRQRPGLHQRLTEEHGYGDPVRWLEYLRTEQARYLVISEPAQFFRHKEFSDYVTAHYPQVEISKSFLVFDLARDVA